MSNETQRDVFEDVLSDLMNQFYFLNLDEKVAKGTCSDYVSRYCAALPDDLPVIPESVGKYIRWCKGKGGIGNVSDAMGYAPTRIASWIYDERNSDTFAHAWLLGVWRVEETGEIVKMEEEK